MQVGTKVHKARIEALGYEVEDMTDIRCCIHVAADYLAELFEKYEGDPALALQAYNGDSSGMRRYYKTGIPSKYAQTILDRSAELERAHGK